MFFWFFNLSNESRQKKQKPQNPDVKGPSSFLIVNKYFSNWHEVITNQKAKKKKKICSKTFLIFDWQKTNSHQDIKHDSQSLLQPMGNNLLIMFNPKPKLKLAKNRKLGPGKGGKRRGEERRGGEERGDERREIIKDKILLFQLWRWGRDKHLWKVVHKTHFSVT